jgi:hypothetical protein
MVGVSLGILVGVKSALLMYTLFETLRFLYLAVGQIVVMHAEIVREGSGKANVTKTTIWWISVLWTVFYFLSNIPV